MAARYYLKECNAFADLESIIEFLSQQHQGELFIEGISGIKIQYDTYTGHVHLVSIEEFNVTNFFSPYISQLLTKPITDAILLLAKMDLILQLDELADAEISSYVRKNHYAKNSTKLINLNHLIMNKTLGQIIKHCEARGFLGLRKMNEQTKIQKAIYQVLAHIDYKKINSREMVSSIMKQINTILNKNAETNFVLPE